MAWTGFNITWTNSLRALLATPGGWKVTQKYPANIGVDGIWVDVVLGQTGAFISTCCAVICTCCSRLQDGTKGGGPRQMGFGLGWQLLDEVKKYSMWYTVILLKWRKERFQSHVCSCTIPVVHSSLHKFKATHTHTPYSVMQHLVRQSSGRRVNWCQVYSKSGGRWLPAEIVQVQLGLVLQPWLNQPNLKRRNWLININHVYWNNVVFCHASMDRLPLLGPYCWREGCKKDTGRLHRAHSFPNFRNAQLIRFKSSDFLMPLMQQDWLYVLRFFE